MLKRLSIQNIAVIKRASLDFREGFTVLTGETGAGKSIIFDSLNLMLGGRAFSDAIRTGEERASVEAVFSADSEIREKLSEMGFETGEDIIFRRNISSSGQNKCYINNCSSTLNSMNLLSSSLFDIHGQHQHQTLKDPANHLEFLDLYMMEADLLSSIEQLYRNIRELEKKLDQLTINEREKAQRIDLLKFQLNEIRKSGFSEDDEQKLLAEKNILVNAEKFNQLISESVDILHESDNSVLSRLQTLNLNISKLGDIDNELISFSETINTSVYGLEDILYSLRSRADSVEYSPEKLEEVESSLSEINNLKRKYGSSLKEVLAHADKCEKELGEIELSDQSANRIKEELAILYKNYEKTAFQLSEKRKATSFALGKAVEKELSDLSFSGARFSIRLTEQHDSQSQVKHKGNPVKFTAKGYDIVEFYISPNIGEDEKPMAKIVSGGELSRIMLALKTVILKNDKGKTLVFDEVDSGIGGKEAEVVGEKLKNLSEKHQVICITHLPQIASFGDNHFRIKKEERNNRTFTDVYKLDYNERISELARMLGGREITETTLMHAREMLRKGQGDNFVR